MADERITDLTIGSTVHAADWLVYVDTTDATMDPSGTDKRVSPAVLSASLSITTSQGSIVAPYCPAGLFACVPGEALDILLTGATAVGGELTYVIVPGTME